MAPISTDQLENYLLVVVTPQCSGSARDVGSLVGTGTHLPCGYMEQLRVCPKVLCNSQEWHPSPLVSLYTPTLWVHGTAQSLPQSALQLTRMAPISIGQLVHTYPVGTWNSSESAPKCFATHKNGTHLHWYTPTLWVHGTAQSLPQSALQLTRMAPISIGQLVHTYPAQSLPQSALQLTRMAPISIGQLVHTYPVGTWNSSESAPKCFATHKNGTHLHWYTPTLWVHGTAQSLPQSALQLTRMAPISIGQLVHTYPVGTWNSSESASKCFATHKNGTHLHCVLDPRVTLGPWLAQVHTYPVGTWNSSESASKCFATHKNGTQLHWSACTHIPCGYMEQLRVCPKVLCNSQEWHPSPLVSLYTPTLWVHGTAQSLPQSALQLTRMAPISIGQLVHTYPVGTWNSSESAPKCFATHKNGTHLHWSACTHLTCGYMEQLRVCPKVLCNSQEWHPSPLVSLYTPTLWVHGTAQSVPQSALQLTRMAPISIGQLVHTDPVGTWNSSESAPKCFATHKNGTHLHWYTPTLWVHGTAQSLPQSALQLTRMAPISIGQLVHTYPVGTWNSSESAPKCFATHKNGTHLHWYTPTLWVHGTAQSVPQSALQLTRMAPISTDQLENYLLVVVTPPVFWIRARRWVPGWRRYTPTLWVHGTAQSLPQSALQLTRMAPNSIGQLVHTYPVGTWNSSESASKCFATHKNGTHLHCVLDPRVTLGPWLAQVHTYPVGTWNSSECASKCTRMAPNSIGQLVHTYPVGTWNSSESASKCFATHKNGTHLHWYTPTLWVHGTAQSLPHSALQLTRMAPFSIGQLVHTYLVGTWNSSESAPKCFATHKNGTIFTGQLVHTYPVGTWNSSESASKCFATHKNGTHLHWYTPTLWVNGTAQSLPQSALQLTRMAPISIGQLVHTYPVGTWNSSECASKCFATHKNGTHLHWSACYIVHPSHPHLGASPDGLLASPDGLLASPDGLLASPDGLLASPDGLLASRDGLLASPDGLLISGIRFTMLKSEAEKTETTTEENVDDALKLACRVESAQKQLHNSEAASATETKGESTNCFKSVGDQDERADKIEVLSRQIRQLSEEMEKMSAPRRSEQWPTGSKDVLCWTCGGQGHIRRNCPKRKSNGILVPK
ncbi:hypothetical protein EMCRGX_G023478 [Ephydatia muelleri]